MSEGKSASWWRLGVELTLQPFRVASYNRIAARPVSRRFPFRIRWQLEHFPIQLDRKAALHPCIIAFSRRKPETTSLENALIGFVETAQTASRAPAKTFRREARNR